MQTASKDRAQNALDNLRPADYNEALKFPFTHHDQKQVKSCMLKSPGTTSGNFVKSPASRAMMPKPCSVLHSYQLRDVPAHVNYTERKSGTCPKQSIPNHYGAKIISELEYIMGNF